MAILSKAEILAAQDIATEVVEVPEWGGSVIVKAMSGVERDSFEEMVLRKGPSGGFEPVMANMRAKLLAKTLVDEDGKALFTDKDVAALGQKSAQVLDRLFTVASRLSGISQSDVDDLAKNSVSARNGGSGSA
jgi:hypothetical protein